VLAGRPPRPERDDPGCLLAMRDVNCTEGFLVVTQGVPADGPVGDAVAALLAGWPMSRVTLLATGVRSREGEREALEERGGEVVAEVQAPASWLQGRRHHHTVVLLDGEPSDTMSTALTDSQPGAVRIQIDASTDGLMDELHRHGVEPERREQM
jgi:hypothetical protein